MKKLLFSSAVAVILLSGCGDDKKESQSNGNTPEIKKEEINNSKNQVGEEKVKDVTQKIEEVKETTTTIVQAKEKIILVPEKVEGEVKEVTTQASIESSNIDASALYTTCGSCHGQKAEKPALGKSQIIAGWDKQRIIDALNGYKNGTYGGIMKNIMTGHINTKTDSEIEALADLISKM